MGLGPDKDAEFNINKTSKIIPIYIFNCDPFYKLKTGMLSSHGKVTKSPPRSASGHKVHDGDHYH